MNNHKVRVELKTASAANKLVVDGDPIFQPYRLYITADQVEIDGIIRFSCDEELKDLMEHAQGHFENDKISAVKIIDAFRFEKTTRDSDGNIKEKTPTSIVRLTFPGSILPSKVIIDGLIIPVELYQRKAMVCDNCTRFGHTQRFCVLKPKCRACGATNHITSSCQLSDTTKCYVCLLQHDPKDKSICPKVTEANRQKQAQARTRSHLAYAEVVKNSVTTSNQFDGLATDVEMEPPTASTSTAQTHQQSNKRKAQVSASHPTLSSTETPSKKKSKAAPQQNGIGFPKEKSLFNSKTVPRPPETQQTNTQTISSMLIAFLELIPIDDTWKRLLVKAVTYFTAHILPLLMPFVSSLVSN